MAGSLNVRQFYIPILLIGLWGLIPERRGPQFLIGASFPMYMIHLLFLSPLLILQKRYGVDGWQVWIAAVIGCLVIANLLKRFCPHLSAFIFGGR